MADAPVLSKGFFQYMLKKELPPGFNPIVQVLEARAIAVNTPTEKSFRLRMSDGYFSYTQCVISSSCGLRFDEEQLASYTPIIQVTSYHTKPGVGKPSFLIDNYILLALNFPIMGNPVPHSGNPAEYSGLQIDSGFYGSQVKNEVENSPRTPKTQNGGQAIKRPANANGTPTDEFRQPLRKKNPADADNGVKALAAGITQINFITPYMNRWAIRGQVSGKEVKQIIGKAKGNQMSLLSFIVSDSAGHSIQVAAFAEQADKFDPLIENGLVYKIECDAHNSVRSANKQYNSTGHEYELILSRDAKVELCHDVIIEPKFKIKQIPLDKIGEHLGECVDVLAVINRIDEVTQVTQRNTMKQLDKREIYLVDNSNTEVRLTLWGQQGFQISAVKDEVIGIKGATVREFNGSLSLSTASGTKILNNPEGPATQKLYSWYSARNHDDIKSLSNTAVDGSFERDLRSIGVLTQYGVDLNVDKNYFYVRAIISNIKTESAFYQACPTEGCKKKLADYNGQYRCEKCDRTYGPGQGKPTIMLQMEIADTCGTGSTWVTLFEDKAQPLLGVSGEELANLQETDHDKFEDVFDRIRYQTYVFRVGLRFETYNDQQKLKWRVWDIKKEVAFEKIKRAYDKSLNVMGILLDDE